MYLHSTMYLLIPDSLSSYFQTAYHLHSTMYLLILTLLLTLGALDNAFTFHYVSINSMSTPNNNTIDNTFTFHYVSINSTC